MTSLTHKMLRDIWHMRAQVLAIALVILSGVAVFIMSLSTLQSLRETRKIYYQSQHFAHVFSGLKRAPNKVLEQIKSINGVQRADVRIVAGIHIEVPDFSDPIQGKLISLKENPALHLNQPYLTKGRFLSEQREEEIMVSDAFAKAHRLKLLDKISIVINGKKKAFSIVGIALSPEYIYQIAPGAIFPDYKRYAIVWMGQRAFESAYGMQGAFNDVSITLLPNTNPEQVIHALDLLLKPYGSLGAYQRSEQLSHHFLEEEFRQLKNMAVMFPIIFFSVAGFLLNIVMMRLIQTERQQIALLKAFGYSNRDVLLHYTKMVMMMIAIGVLAGIAVGAWMGKNLSLLYTDFYKFPYLFYTLSTHVVASAVLICFTVAITGALIALKDAYRLMPADGMRPAAPPAYAVSIFEKSKMLKNMGYFTRMIYRSIERRPVKVMMTIIGIASAVGILMIGSFQKASIDHMMDVQFNLSQKEDLQLSFNDAVSARAIYSLEGIPGIQQTEGQRSVPVRLRHAHRNYLTSIQAVSPDQQLRKILDDKLQQISIPQEGIVLSAYFREILDVNIGDRIQVETLEGKRNTQEMQVVGFVQEFMGLGAYVSFESIYKLLQDGPSLNGAVIKLVSERKTKIFDELKEMPMISGISFKENTKSSFYDTLGDTILVFTFFISFFGGTLAFGLIFNNAIISFAEKNRELATLRVIGLTQVEVTYILLGELALLTLIAIPIGFIFGTILCQILANTLQSELYRVPLILKKFAFAYACLIVLFASACSSYFLYRKVTKLDMIATLKAQE